MTAAAFLCALGAANVLFGRAAARPTPGACDAQVGLGYAQAIQAATAGVCSGSGSSGVRTWLYCSGLAEGCAWALTVLDGIEDGLACMLCVIVSTPGG